MKITAGGNLWFTACEAPGTGKLTATGIGGPSASITLTIT